MEAVRLRLDIGYDGTDFFGWAVQPGLRTVQGDIESALGKILRLVPAPVLTVAGRTDAGVHARGQVAHVDLPVAAIEATSRDPAPTGVAERLPALLRRIAGVLSQDVRVHRLSVAPAGFDARFSAMSRRYCYRVSDSPGGVDPLRRREILRHSRPLDADLLNAAGELLLGEHDFAAFCKKRAGATTIRELQRLTWARGEDGVLAATVVADAFCHSMVRALIGCLLWVGDGRRDITWPREILAHGMRDSNVNVAPAHGLCLEEVAYPPAHQLAARATLTRRVRTLEESD